MYSLIGSDFSDIILVTIFSRNRYLIFKNCLQAFKGYILYFLKGFNNLLYFLK